MTNEKKSAADELRDWMRERVGHESTSIAIYRGGELLDAALEEARAEGFCEADSGYEKGYLAALEWALNIKFNGAPFGSIYERIAELKKQKEEK
jgi:hypothetical protein